MNTNIRELVNAVERGVTALMQDRAEYLNDRHPRQAAHEAELRRFDETLDRHVSDGASAIDKELVRVRSNYSKHVKKSWSAIEVAEAWRRVQALLDAGVGLDRVIAMLGKPGFGREAAQALRENLPTHLIVKAGGKDVDGAEHEAQAALQDVLRAEMPMMDSNERSATEQLLDIADVEPALQQLGKIVTTAKTRGLVSAQDVLSLGFAMGEGR